MVDALGHFNAKLNVNNNQNHAVKIKISTHAEMPPTTPPHFVSGNNVIISGIGYTGRQVFRKHGPGGEGVLQGSVSRAMSLQRPPLH